MTRCLSHTAPHPPFNARLFREALQAHAARWGLAYLLVGLSAWGFQRHYAIAVNLSPSLPQQVFLIEKGKPPQRGDLVAFRWQGHGKPVTFVKILTGLPGDTVHRVDRTYFVDSTAVGVTKTHSLKGAPLALGPAGTLPPGRYYVSAPHPDSLDSRYALVGWIAQDQIIGKAHALF